MFVAMRRLTAKTLLATLVGTVLVLALLCPPLLGAQDARYNLATVQKGKRIGVPLDGEGKGTIYFYNVDGNRTTHIALRVSRAPAGWEVRVEPPQGVVRVGLAGQVVEVVENLHVEPTPLLAEEAKSVPEGSVSISIPGQGYAIGKVAQVVVRAPESAAPGSKGEVKVSAEASWLGQSGDASIKQERDFDFVAEVAPPGWDGTETILPDEQGSSLGETVERWMPTIVALVIVIVGAVVIPTLAARRARGDGDR